MADDPRQSPSPDGSEGTRLDLFPVDKDIHAILAELETQTDRGTALICGAILEWRVRQILNDRFFRTTSPPYGPQKAEIRVAAGIVGDDKKSGELSYSKQCDLAFCLGMFGPATRRDMHRIGEIRNKFAHPLDVAHFEHPIVKDICGKLEIRGLVHLASQSLVDYPTPDFVKMMITVRDGESSKVKFLNTVITAFCLLHTVSVREQVGWPQVTEGKFPYL